VIGVGHESILESIFRSELLLRLGFVGRDADDLGLGFRKFLVCVAKLARLFRSTGRVGLREEEDNNALPLHFRKLEVAGFDFRRAIARFESHTLEIVN
jgi:hypothetical protein